LHANLLPTVLLEHQTTLPDGRVAEWEASGEGDEPLVWVEGGPSLPAYLARPDVALVGHRFRSYLVNAPGSGRSSAPPTDDGYSLEAVVDFFDAWRQAPALGP
jgi:pimeloyl-ACP methyl ester carboxylesterase